MLHIEYQYFGDEWKNLSAEEQHAKIAFQRASDIKAIFDLLSIADVSQHYRICESLSPDEDLTLALRGIAELGSNIADGLWNEIDCLENISKTSTTFLLPEQEVEQ